MPQKIKTSEKLALAALVVWIVAAGIIYWIVPDMAWWVNAIISGIIAGSIYKGMLQQTALKNVVNLKD